MHSHLGLREDGTEMAQWSYGVSRLGRATGELCLIDTWTLKDIKPVLIALIIVH